MITDLLRSAELAMGRGDLFSAYDIASAGLERAPDNMRFRYLQVLALVRMGDLDQAKAQYDRLALGTADDVDTAALGARLLKDAALRQKPRRQSELIAASDAYRAIYLRTGDNFPGINAATLALLGGEEERAQAIAAEILAKPDAAPGYYARASRAEALLLCGRTGEAAGELAAACALPDADAGARGTTRHQLALIAEHLGLSAAGRAELLRPLAAPCVVMFCGHIMPKHDVAAQAALARAVAAALAEEGGAIGFGALASGADIIIAEELLRQQGELNVVLPFAETDFVRQSVEPSGREWVQRYQECLRRARSVTVATDMPFMDDPAQFSHGSLVCMGLARLRAQHLGADVLQLAVWDGVLPLEQTPAGTALDVMTWRKTGGRVRVIPPTWKRPDPAGPARLSPIFPATDEPRLSRETRAFIFTDFRGFTKLKEPALPLFWREVMQRMFAVVARYGTEVCYTNTWGDALYAVVDNTRTAAALALALQQSLSEVDYVALGIEPGPHMRVGAHYGQVFRATGAGGALHYYGTQVSRTARIEPITPPGAVYVTEQFAAALAMEAPEEFTSSYVGPVPLAKGYGPARMHLLRAV